jgi:hypothetical protein
VCVIVMTICWSAIRSSMSISSSDGASWCGRSSPNASATSRSSVLDEVEHGLLVAEQRAQLA